MLCVHVEGGRGGNYMNFRFSKTFYTLQGTSFFGTKLVSEMGDFCFPLQCISRLWLTAVRCHVVW
jgi:hypothetical protein